MVSSVAAQDVGVIGLKSRAKSAAEGDCDYGKGWLPLKGISLDCAEKYYSQNSWVGPLSQVRFLYGSDTKSVSADLVAPVLPLANTQIIFGSSVTSSPAASTPAEQQSSAATQAIEHLKAGGDFFVRTAYPVFVREDVEKHYWIAGLFLTPRIGFNVKNFGLDSTITEGTEIQGSLASEAYAQLGLPDKVFVYTDLRGGGQFVQKDFAQAVGLGSTTKFGFGQVSFGVQIAGLLRVGGELYLGPEKAFNLSAGASRWHLSVQLAPSKK